MTPAVKEQVDALEDAIRAIGNTDMRIYHDAAFQLRVEEALRFAVNFIKAYYRIKEIMDKK